MGPLPLAFTLALACRDDSGTARETGDTAPAGDSGVQEPSWDDPRVSVGGVEPCAAPLQEARWQEATGAWAVTYTEEPPVRRNGTNPGSVAILGVPGAWSLSWVQPEGVVRRGFPEGTIETFGAGGRAPHTLALGDLDGDGALDLVHAGGAVAVSWAAERLDAPAAAPVPLTDMRSSAATVDAALGDLDRDGDLDVLVAWSSPAHDPTTMRATVLRNDGARALTQLEIAGVPSEVWGPAFDWSIRDVDGDGRLDAYLCNDMGMQYAPNRLFLGDGALGFSASGGDGLDVRLSCMGSSWGDMDADGTMELYVAESVHHVLLQRGPDGVWYDVAEASGLGGRFPNGYMMWGSAAEDLDNDGRMEIVAGTGDFWEQDSGPNAPFWAERGDDGIFHEVGLERGLPAEAHSRAVVARDLNSDGVLDLVLGDAVRTPRVYLSEGCTAESWLEVAGPPGSEVRVEAGGRARAARIDTESGWGGAGPSVGHVGLGDAAVIDRVVLRSPLGEELVLEGPMLPRRRIRYTP
jgi:hypothetical protein